jgi:hypothetical protein
MRRLLCLLLCLVPTAIAAETCNEISQAKLATYGFRPSQMNRSEQQKKSVQMDAFWNRVKAAGPAGIECVRGLIAAEKTGTYFLFDAASLLNTFDASGASDDAIEDGLLRTDLVDVDMSGYIHVALALSHRGRNISKAAARYLHYANVDTYLPAHGGYKVDRTTGAIMLYGSMHPEQVDEALIPELNAAEQSARDTAATVLALNMTARSFGELATLDTTKFSPKTQEHIRAIRTYHRVTVTPPKYSREQILAKLRRFPELDPDIDEAENKALDNSLYATLLPEDLPTLREARRRLVQGVSNESVEGYQEMSRILYNVINKLDLFSQDRIH